MKVSTSVISRRVYRGPTGHRVGESHHRSKLTGDDVRLIRQLIEETDLGDAAIARKFEVSRWTVRDIRKGLTRIYG